MRPEIAEYKKAIFDCIDQIEQEEESILKAAEIMADAIEKDQLIHIIGTGGHSNMAAEEVFWRAGGLAPINALLDGGINLCNGARRSNIVERCEGYAETIFKTYQLGKDEGEVLIIATAYGVNAITIEMAMEAKKRGMKVIAVTARAFADNLPKDQKLAPARHSSCQNLYEMADVFVDVHLPFGDAIIRFDGFKQPVGPVSTYCNSFALHCLVIETVRILLERGVEPPVWMSANLPGGHEANKRYEDKYGPRMRHL
ncbi:MAG: SIS domain-containing protein [Clostridia bacterium]|nr:SIS domain-containing protein [Clostridia bacterium]